MTVRLRKHLDSETLHLPELAPLLGKDVEIVVTEEPTAEHPSPAETLVDLVGKDVVDPEAYKELRARSVI